MKKIKNCFKNIEKCLLNNMGVIAFTFILIIFITWIISLSISEKIISTQYMLTTIGAIFAFWYGYKKYERDKKIEQINTIMELTEKDSFEKIILKWYTGLKLKNEGFLNNDLFRIIELYGEQKLLSSIGISKDFIEVNWIISHLLILFNKNKYIIQKIKILKKFLKEQGEITNKNYVEVIKIIEILEKNDFNK